MQEIVLSLISCSSVQIYTRSPRGLIPRIKASSDFGQPRAPLKYLRCNFICKALGIKAKIGGHSAPHLD